PLFQNDRTQIPYNPLKPENRSDDSLPTLLVVPEPKDGEARRANEAGVVVEYIKSQLVQGFAPEQIALLFRGSIQIPPFEEALRKAGIPCRSLNSGGLFDQIEIFDLLNLLHVLENPTDQTPLIGVLRSPVVGLSDDTITKMVLQKTVFDLVPPERTLPEESMALHRLKKLLEKLKSLKNSLPISEFITQVIQESDLDLVQPNSQGKENLARFVHVCRGLSDKPLTLKEFLNRIEGLIAKGVKEELAQPPETVGGVQLMTIHKAKGLEFPIVILPDLKYRPNPGSIPFLINDQEVLTCHSVILDNQRIESFHHAWASFEEQDRELSESKRLFYVACTRAISRLALVVSENAFEKDEDSIPLRTGSWERWVMQEGVRKNFEVRYPGTVLLRHPEPKAKDLNAGENSDPSSARPPQDDKEAPPQDDGERPWQPISEIPILVTPSPISTTITEMASYLFCPLAHHYRYREDILVVEGNQQVGHGKDIGDWTHLVLQKWFPFKADLDEVIQGLEIPKEFQNRVKALAKCVFHRGIKEYFPSNGEGNPEYTFLVSRDGHLIEGVIDLALFDGGTWTIIDYKTKANPNRNLSNLIEQYSFQMLSYATALTQLTNKSVSRVALLFLDGPLAVDLPWDSQVHQKVLGSWDDTLRGMQNQHASPRHDHCPKCLFKNWCPESRGELVPGCSKYRK
ncbi:MAG TPA: 3'-5' exonuclease, partial [Bdellovibrionota bacterium]|nr:3'-5' exonuclease [Bdellovibrionota bacterium]